MKYIHKFLSHKSKLGLPKEKLYKQVDRFSGKRKIASELEFNDSFNKISRFIKDEKLDKDCYISDDTAFMVINWDLSNFYGTLPKDTNIETIIVDPGKRKIGKSIIILPLDDEWYSCKLFYKGVQYGGSYVEWKFECDSIEGVFQLIIDFSLK